MACGVISHEFLRRVEEVIEISKQLMKKELITTIDHLVFGAYSLDEGVDFIYQKLGVMPNQGGKHPLMGTHNKLLKLGRSIYLEIIAIDPDATKPNRPRWFGLDDLQPASKPKLLTWVAD